MDKNIISQALITRYTELHKVAGASVDTKDYNNPWAPEYVSGILCAADYDFNDTAESIRLVHRSNEAHRFIDAKVGMFKKVAGDAFTALHGIAQARCEYVTSLETTMTHELTQLHRVAPKYDSVEHLIQKELPALVVYDEHRKGVEKSALDDLYANLVTVAQRLETVHKKMVVRVALKGVSSLLVRNIKKVTHKDAQLMYKGVYADAKRMDSLTSAILSARHT